MPVAFPPIPPVLESATKAHGVINSRDADLDPSRWSYKLGGGQFGLDAVIQDSPTIDENEMSMEIHYADGNHRDGVGDLLEVAGIDCSRHIRNAIVGFDHFKANPLPIGMAEDPGSGVYLNYIDPIAKTAKVKAFFYRGNCQQTGFDGIDACKKNDHALFCEQVFDLAVKRFLKSGSLGYQVKRAVNLSADYETGIPSGLHLLSTLLLEASLVVLPANSMTVNGKGLDIARQVLAMPKICGKAISPYLVKSFSPIAAQNTKVISGYEGKSGAQANTPAWLMEEADKPGTKAFKGGKVDVPLQKLPEGQVPPPTWKPGVGATVKDLRKKYGKKGGLTGTKGWETWLHAVIAAIGALTGNEALAASSLTLMNMSDDDELEDMYESRTSPTEAARKWSKKALSSLNETTGGALRAPACCNGCGKGKKCGKCSKAQPSDKISKQDAEAILKAGTAQGKPLTQAQEGMFQAAAHKSLDLRKKHRPLKHLRRRLKGSRPGSSVMHISAKDVDAAKKLAEGKGCKFHHMGANGGHVRIKLVGDDAVMDEVAKSYGVARRVLGKAMPETKNTEIPDGRELVSTGGNSKPQLAERNRRDEARDSQRSGDRVLNLEPKVRTKAVTECPDCGGKVTNGVCKCGWKAKGMGDGVVLSKPIVPTRSQKVKGTKAMPDEQAVPDAESEVPEADLNDDGEVTGEEEEKYSAQLIRRLHQDCLLLLEEYDTFTNLNENENVGKHLKGKLEALVGELDELESLFEKEHPDLHSSKPLEGMGETGEKGEEEADAGGEEEPMDEFDREEGPAVEADSEEEELPEPEEVVEGMEKENKNLRVRLHKALRQVHGKSGKGRGLGIEDGHMPGNEEADNSGLRKAPGMKGKKSNEGPGPDDEGEDLGVEGSHVPGHEEHDEQVGDTPSDSHGDHDLGIEGSHEPGYEDCDKALEPHQHSAVGMAADYCKKLTTEHNFGEDHRHEAYHFSKALEGIEPKMQMQAEVPTEGMNDEMPALPMDDTMHGLKKFPKMGQTPNSKMGKAPGTEKAEIAHTELKELNPIAHEAGRDFEGDDQEMPKDGLKDFPAMDDMDAGANVQTKSFFHHRKNIGAACKYFKALSKTYDFGEKNRQEAAVHHAGLSEAHKAMDPMIGQDEMAEVQEPDSNDQDVVPPPGDIGEKSLAIRQAALRQNEQLMLLAKQLTEAQSRLSNGHAR